MKLQTDPVLKIEGSIARTRERIARWDTEADEVEVSWTGGPDYRKFCQAMADAAREKKAALEAELKRLQGHASRNATRPGTAVSSGWKRSKKACRTSTLPF